MARTPLSDIQLSERIKQAALSGGNAIVVQNSQGTTATLYAASTGSTTITNSQTLNNAKFIDGLLGWLEPGSYKFTCGGAVAQVFDTSATDEVVGDAKPSDDLLSVANECPRLSTATAAATTTDGTIQFIRIVPDKKITAASLVFVSGAAVA